MDQQPVGSPAPERRSTRQIILRVVKFVLLAIVIYFAGVQIVENWHQVVAYPWVINPWLLILSMVLYLLTFALFSQVWCWLMRGFGYRPTLTQGFKIAYISTLGRYIPGRIWPVFGMVYVARQAKINEEAAVASWGMSILFSLPPSFALAALAIWLEPQMLSGQLGKAIGPSMLLVVGLTLLVSLVLIFAPKYPLWLANTALRILRRPPITFRLTIPQALAVYFGYFAAWIAYGLAFWVFVHAITPHSGMSLIAGIGSYVLSYQIGYLAVFTPGGLGARELVMIGLLEAYMGPAAAGVAVASRLWSTVGDIIASVIALKLKI